MPKKKSKKFIDKKHAATFHLVHRSQKDPLIVDENAPQRILQPLINKNKGNADEFDNFGVYFDEDYEYLNYLKPADDDTTLVKVDPPIPKESAKTKVSLPSSLFASHVEEPIGLLEKAAPKSGLDLSLDPDIVAAMDSDYEPGDSDEEFFDDNFIEKLDGRPARKKKSGGDSDESGDEDGENEDMYDDYTGEDLYNEFTDEEDDGRDYYNDDVKSRFTEYSMTSSVIHRNEQLRLLDDKFEQVYASYDDYEIGALNSDEITGFKDYEFEGDTQIFDESERKEVKIAFETQPTTYQSDSESNCSEEELFEVKEKEKWDCESIISTYSNIYNHPKLIGVPQKIRINPKTGIPEIKKKLTAKALNELNAGTSDPSSIPKVTGPGSLVSLVSQLSIRPKDECPEDRKARKQSFKLYKKERRIEKKMNTQAFKEEKSRMEKMMTNTRAKHIQIK